MQRFLFYLLFGALNISTISHAQTIPTFIRTHGGVWTTINGKSVVQKKDGTYLVVSSMGNNWDMYVLHLSAYGDSIGSFSFDASPVDHGADLIVDSDSTLIVIGTSEITSPSLGKSIFVVRCNFEGDTIWTRHFGGFVSDEEGSKIIETSDGNYLVAGITNNFGGLTMPYLVKFDSNGSILWNYPMAAGPPQYDYSVKSLVENNGEYYISGQYGNGLFIQSFSSSGILNMNREYSYPSISQCTPFATLIDGGYVTVATDSGFVLAGTKKCYLQPPGTNDFFVIKLLPNLDTIWTKSFDYYQNVDEVGGILRTPQGGYLVYGSTDDLAIPGSDLYKIMIDNQGNKVWEKTLINNSNSFSFANNAVVCNDGGIALTGYIYTPNQTHPDNSISIIKFLDPTCTTSGQVFADVNQDCLLNAGDVEFRNKIVRLDPGPYFGVTDTSGNFRILSESGTFQLSILPDEYWDDPCISSIPPIQLNNLNDSITGLSFGLKSNFTCPSPWIDISTGILRASSSANYFINYGNYGLPASNIQIKVELNPCFTPLSSSPVWDSYQNNTLSYNIGSLSILETGSIRLSGIVCANAGQVICAKAIISPTFICNPPDSAFDRNNLLVYGNCISNDTVRFIIKNQHPNIFVHNGVYEIYENNSIAFIQPFSIVQNDSIIVYYPANNNSVRIQIKFLSSNGVNYYDGPQITVDKCNGSFGPLNQLSQSDEPNYYEIVCTTIVPLPVLGVPNDPNDKIVSPVGIQPQGYISPEQTIEYQINFQNVGTGPATYVMIKDSISAELDIGTLIPGVSSHNYTFNIYGSGVTEWVFPNIFLPDSASNEPDSKGFVKFKIKQKPNNTYGTEINNDAFIYFDFNEPVQTNKTVNVVCELPIAQFTSSVAGFESLQFTNNSIIADQYLWLFGDSTFSTEENPLHTFPGPGLFTVCLYAANSCEESVTCQNVNVLSTGLIQHENVILISPIPANEMIHITMNSDFHNWKNYEILDITGRVVLTNKIESYKFNIRIDHLADGIYFVNLNNFDGQNKVSKFIVQNND